MADWVHCNICYYLAGSGRKFCLTNCGHIYCECCVMPGSRLTCEICGNHCTTILLAGKMKPDVEMYFADTIDLWKKHTDEAYQILNHWKAHIKKTQTIIQIMNFQKNHRKRLTAYSREKFSSQLDVLSKAEKSAGQVQDLEREVVVLKDENAYLKVLLSTRNGQAARTPPAVRLSPGSSSHTPTQGQTPLNILQCNLQKNQKVEIPGRPITPNTASPMTGPSRISVRTPPNHMKSGVSHSQSLQRHSGFGDSTLSEVYENRHMQKGSPMNTSPAQITAHPVPLPPTCMPITPNRPTTPNYAIDFSAALTTTCTQRMAGQRACPVPVQINYKHGHNYRV